MTITADQVAGIDFKWDGVEKTPIDDAQENYFKPAAIALGQQLTAQLHQLAQHASDASAQQQQAQQQAEPAPTT